jgi:glycerophosphoryl diester phosphodiesterase
LLVSSFRFEELSTFGRAMPSVCLAVLVEYPSAETFDFARSIQAAYLNVSHHIVTRKLVQRADKLGLRVLAFTVNSVAEAEELRSMGVSGVFTDHIDLLKEYAATKRAS